MLNASFFAYYKIIENIIKEVIFMIIVTNFKKEFIKPIRKEDVIGMFTTLFFRKY